MQKPSNRHATAGTGGEKPTTKGSNVIVPKEYHEGASEALMVLFKIISRRSWENLQDWHAACPGSYIEHLCGGMYILHIPADGTANLGEFA